MNETPQDHKIREVSREPEVPPLSELAKQLLTDLCFRKNDPIESCDLLFIYGTRKYVHRAVPVIREFLDAGATRNVIITGGATPEKPVPESQLILDMLNQGNYPQIEFTVEGSSTNTHANVVEALKLKDFSNASRIAFVFQSYAAGRGYLTLRKFCPNTRFIQLAYDVDFQGSEGVVTASNWELTQVGQKRIWGEFERIRTYGRRGDLAFHEVRDPIERIEKLTTT